MKSPVLLLSTLLLFSAVALPAAEDAAPKPIRFNADAREVVLDVVVRDHKERPISGLSTSDIQVLDGGHAAKITQLKFISESEEKTCPADALGHPALVSLVFDSLSPGTASLARDIALKYLRFAAAADVYTSVWRVGDHLEIAQPFTLDGAAIKDAIQQVTSSHADDRVSPESEKVVKQLQASADAIAKRASEDADPSAACVPKDKIAAVTWNALQTSQRLEREQRGNSSLISLLAISHELGEVPGRKAVLYFSGDGMSAANTEQTRTVVSAANTSGVSVSVIDARGLVDKQEKPSINLAFAIPRSNSAIVGTGPTGADRGVIQTTVEKSKPPTALAYLSSASGGILISDTNHLKSQFPELLDNLRSYYQVYYVPAPAQAGESFHEVAIRVNRPKAEVRAGGGYYAVAPTESISPYETPLINALSERIPPGDLKFRSAAVQLGTSAGKVRGAIVVEIPTDQIDFQSPGPGEPLSGSLTLLSVLTDKDHRVVQKLSRQFSYSAAAEKLAQIKSRSFVFDQAFEVLPGAYRLETAIIDGASGKTSVQRRDFQTATHGDGPDLSQLIAVKNLDSLTGSDSDSVFRLANSNVTPTLDLQVHGGDPSGINVYFRARMDPSIPDAPSMHFSLLQNGEEIARFPVKFPAAVSQKPTTLAFVTTVPTSSLDAGAYQVKAVLRQGSKSREEEMAFTVEGGEVRQATKMEETPAAVAALPEPVQSALTPSTAEQKILLESARDYALKYTESLPNFFCTQITHRWTGQRQTDAWRAKDGFIEELRFVGGHESYKDVKTSAGAHLNGTRPNDGVISTGEFGSALRSIFNPEVHAEFSWQKLVNLKSGRAHIFAYVVPLAHSQFSLVENTPGNYRQFKTGFHGEVTIDDATRRVHRLTVILDNVAPTYPLQAVHIEVRYSSVRIGDQQYMLPSIAILTAQQGKHALRRNEIEFHDYHQYIADSKIHFSQVH